MTTPTNIPSKRPFARGSDFNGLLFNTEANRLLNESQKKIAFQQEKGLLFKKYIHKEFLKIKIKNQ